MSARTRATLAAAALFATTIACSRSPAAPSTPAASTSLAGAWRGSGSDPHGVEKLTWTLTQTGSAFSGTVVMEPADPTDGSCGSCHKYKSGTVTGAMSGSTLTLKVIFPSGGDVPTPMCAIAFDVAAPDPAGTRIAGTYSGDDSCEGLFTGGTLQMAR